MHKDEASYDIEASSGKIRDSLGALDKELQAIEAWLDALGRDADAVNAKLREAKERKTGVSPEPKPAMPQEVKEQELEARLDELKALADDEAVELSGPAVSGKPESNTSAGEIDVKESRGVKKILNGLLTSRNA
jgi:hypothetical protein